MKIGVISIFGGFSPVAARMSLEVGNDNVRICYIQKHYKNLWNGLLPKVETVEELKRWNPDFIIFDMSGEGELAQDLIEDGFNVIGSSIICDALEMDRWVGTKTIKTLGFNVPETVFVKSVDDVKKFLKKRDPTERWVIKFNENQSNFSSYVSDDVIDMIEEVTHFTEGDRVSWKDGAVLQKFIKGIELSCEGWFDGHNFVPDGFNYTMEEKKFLTGSLGPTTGCEGNLVWKANPSDNIPKNLKRFAPVLRNYKYVGPIDVNSIISEDDHKAYIIEPTPRFGYDAIYSLLEGFSSSVSGFFSNLLLRQLKTVPIFDMPLIAVRVSVPPYPHNDLGSTTSSKLKKLQDATSKFLQHISHGTIINLKTPQLLPHVWFQDVSLDAKKGNLIVNGVESVVAVCSSKRQTLQGAIDAVYSVVKSVDVPDAQYRLDIGKRAIEEIPKLIEWKAISSPSWFKQNIPSGKKESKLNLNTPQRDASQNNPLSELLTKEREDSQNPKDELFRKKEELKV